MRGLIKKDIFTMKKSILLVTIMTVAILIFAIQEDGYFMVPMLYLL